MTNFGWGTGSGVPAVLAFYSAGGVKRFTVWRWLRRTPDRAPAVSLCWLPVWLGGDPVSGVGGCSAAA
ncbi:hypothetical protein KCP74_12995 [Salmonella enterica subsp. enterica]|nr:hypothetical protein KCP74_12995 [Salmonella enterica subsp. enterica]